MKNEFKNFDEYFKVNEELQEEETQVEIYASKLGLNGCKIIGASEIDGGVKLDIRDSSSLLGWSEITIKNGKIDVHTEFYDENDD